LVEVELMNAIQYSMKGDTQVGIGKEPCGMFDGYGWWIGFIGKCIDSGVENGSRR
jgi:hypothetical protein